MPTIASVIWVLCSRYQYSAPSTSMLQWKHYTMLLHLVVIAINVLHFLQTFGSTLRLYYSIIGFGSNLQLSKLRLRHETIMKCVLAAASFIDTNFTLYFSDSFVSEIKIVPFSWGVPHTFFLFMSCNKINPKLKISKTKVIVLFLGTR